MKLIPLWIVLLFLISSILFSGDFVLEKVIDEEGELSGQLLDMKTDEPIKGAFVSIIGMDINTYSDDEGYYNLKVPVGEWKLHISADDYKDLYYRVVAVENECGDIEITITYDTGNVIKGIVRDSETDRPIAYAAVSIPELDTGSFTEANGKFVIKNVNTGIWDVQAELVGYHTNIVKDVEVVEGGITEIEIILESTALEGYYIRMGPEPDDK